MPRYVGAPSPQQASGEAVASGRRDVLTQQMEAARQSNESFFRFAGMAQQGLEGAQQDEQMQRRESLEAARQGLEFDPQTRRYKKSAETAGREKADFEAGMLEREQGYRHREQTQLVKGGQAIDEAKLAKRAATVQEAEVGLKSRQLGMQEKRYTAAERKANEEADLDLAREERLQRTMLHGEEEDKRKALSDEQHRIEKRVDDLDQELRKVMSPQLLNASDAMLASVAERMGLAKSGGGSGGWTREQLASAIQAKRSQVLLSHMKVTGDSSMFDFAAPENKPFVQMLEVVRSLYRNDAQWNPAYLHMSYDERQRMAKRTAAKVFLGLQQGEQMSLPQQGQGQGQGGSKFMQPQQQQQGQQQQQQPKK